MGRSAVVGALCVNVAFLFAAGTGFCDITGKKQTRAVTESSGTVTFGSPFTDGMVLQRGVKAPVWGWAQPGQCVTVSFAGQQKDATADAKGRWIVFLDPLVASKQGRELRANGMTVKDVLVGEVWFCSGQSNCGVPVCGDNPHYRERYGAMRAQITNNPYVRLASWARHSIALEPLERTENPVRWYSLTPDNLMKRDAWATSSIAFQFARDLYEALDVPIGVLQHFWGGVGIDSWIPREGYEKHPELAYEKNLKRYAKTDYKPEHFERAHFKLGYQQQPMVLWNAFVAPVAPYAIKGLIWHQGCNNAGKDEAPRYAAKLHALYDGWSENFANPDFKLYYAQLADFHDHGQIVIRLQQAQFEKEEPHAAMAVTSDTGVFTDIHSPDKSIVGTRLALKALKRDYGYSIEDSSPEVKNWSVETNTVRLVFSHAKSIYFYNADWSLDNLFDLKGEDGKWHPATIVNYRPENPDRKAKGRLAAGTLVGEGLVLSAKGVTVPTGVRYLFRAPYRSNVYNEVNLPLGPFTTEQPSRFGGVTKSEKVL